MKETALCALPPVGQQRGLDEQQVVEMHVQTVGTSGVPSLPLPGSAFVPPCEAL